MSDALEGILVLALEQAVAAPYCSSRLADAGARVIKVERAEGDFARLYDQRSIRVRLDLAMTGDAREGGIDRSVRADCSRDHTVSGAPPIRR